MLLSLMCRSWFPGALVSLWVSASFAQAVPEGAASSPRASAGGAHADTEDERGAVVLALRGDALDGERLRTLLETELKREVVLEHASRPQHTFGVLTFAYRRDAAELAVTWDSGGQTLTRVVAAPSDSASLEGDAALLAGNLSRRQIEDLLPAPVVAAAVAPTAPAASVPVLAPSADTLPPPEQRLVTVGLFYPLASHYGEPEVTSSLDMNLVHGRVGAIDGAQLGGVNVIGRSAGPAWLKGFQIGYAANVVGGSATGVQLAGALNHVSGDVTGAQLALGANLAQGAVRGLQDSFLFNRAGDLRGMQLAAVNVAGDVDGVQLGLINIAHRVRGAAIGLVNIADDIDGLPLAPFSVTRTGGVHASAWSGTSGLGNVGVKLATRRTYTLFFGSYHRDFELEFVGGGFALGGSVELGAGFRSSLDVCGTYLVAPEKTFALELNRGYHEQLVQPRLRLMVDYRVARHFGAFVGVAAMGQIRSELGWDQLSGSVGPEIFGGVEL
ncbi:MAG: hypothetical protein RL685_2105 [Pseudomonadota bacterium]|jgi:hypothetical protein